MVGIEEMHGMMVDREYEYSYNKVRSYSWQKLWWFTFEMFTYLYMQTYKVSHHEFNGNLMYMATKSYWISKSPVSL